MCGIAGFVGPRQDSALLAMRDAIAHRGPDASGIFADTMVSLAHRRLSIVDLSTGQQPMSNAAGNVHITFNGEIYNHQKLRQNLEKCGHKYRTTSDTETILHAYQQVGLQLPKLLDGMFAFVLYDQTRRRLVGARDRFGKKPIYLWSPTFASLSARSSLFTELAPSAGMSLQASDSAPCFAFASEIKALKAHPAITSMLPVDPQAILSYLCHDYVLGSRRIYQTVVQIPPGCAFALELTPTNRPTLQLWKYWDFNVGSRPKWFFGKPISAHSVEPTPTTLNQPDADPSSNANNSPAENEPVSEHRGTATAELVDTSAIMLPAASLDESAVAEIELALHSRVSDQPATLSRLLVRYLHDAVEKRLMSDVPLGVFLSGGIDSSSIVSIMRAFRPANEIHTFSIKFDDPTFDESPYSQFAARHFGTNHAERAFTSADLQQRLPGIVAQLDEPFADPSLLPVTMLSEFAREQVTVALGGDGGDEIFAGYDPMRAVEPASWVDLFMPGLGVKALSAIAGLLPTSTKNMGWDFRVRRFLRGAAAHRSLRCPTWMGPFEPAGLMQLCPELLKQTSLDQHLGLLADAYFEAEASAESDLDPALDFFTRFYLPDDILVKVDRASMLHSLEVRCPFLDTQLSEFGNMLPARWKLNRQRTKLLLKQAMLMSTEELGDGLPSGLNGLIPLLPKEIVERKKKGFGIPVARWIHTDLHDSMRDVLLDAWPTSLDFIERAERERLWQRHLANKENLYKELWALFMLGLWARAHLN